MNKSLLEKDKEFIWHPFTAQTLTPPPLPVTSAKGSLLTLEDGREIIDAIASWWVNIHGHGNEELAEVIKQQVLDLDHIIFAGFAHQPSVALAEKLQPLLPGNLHRFFFSDNGSTATEVALKMAIQYFWNKGDTKRKKVIALEGAYHGDTFGALSMAARTPFSAPFDDYLFDVLYLPFPTEENEKEVYELMEEYCASEEVCAFIFEPLVQGASGMRMYSAKTLDHLIGIAQSFGTLCIADEVMTGFYRTGKLFATNYLTDHAPDILCCSKALTAGILPMGLTICTQEIYSAYLVDDMMKTFFHGHSFTGNPITCALALKSLEMLIGDERQEQIKTLCNSQKMMAEKLTALPYFSNVRVTGSILALDYINEAETSYFNSIRNELYNWALSNNILLRPLGNTLYILTNYTIKTEELEKVYQLVSQLGTLGLKKCLELQTEEE
ncbi:adenosylmethionine--8-amino-7-oxononanoate transaminase [Flammeovirga yaeyamensis]|uniref:Adenosylmethionine-8-amino-7-oxononanoate aminotransferase n=1 Tax=Flammeovirga yaeyamensis TaxID=367791 RepID=A0AAX1N441_9BACT|nr:adenosylmethionine--8-amino-7-oxononanoate transaminase [Flammeovirga yaeyamensis]MBB3700926.1 adenosylmethionine-8-amino-7-oxononanoate aminotransferase [Flammeovirga yaeyamensis]NMF38033.1 adenosylmethionine--8-amino-7-oxononanoate transaminase [Flammeovirga yaeyamensis]QWG00683.1 adenosylmethionine--8-amino-7-oxononanoate transaminase [Flammeovirga yaeyamensis]